MKAQNVMITPDNTAKLIDFGIAKGPNHATLTDPSHFAGTLYYAPPEQILETHNVDHRADLYALGVVLFEMLMAALPVQSREFGEAASRIINGDLDPVTGVGKPIAKLVNYMLATEIENRIPSADEVIKIIDSIGEKPVVPDLPETILQLGDDIPQELKFSDTTVPIEVKLMYMLTTDDGREFALDKAETIIGRSHPRDTVTPDIDLMQLGVEHARTASRRHCRVYFDDGEYYVEDLGSMNGTRLNGDPLKQGDPKHLELGDIVSAGRVDLAFQGQAS